MVFKYNSIKKSLQYSRKGAYAGKKVTQVGSGVLGFAFNPYVLLIYTIVIFFLTFSYEHYTDFGSLIATFFLNIILIPIVFLTTASNFIINIFIYLAIWVWNLFIIILSAFLTILATILFGLLIIVILITSVIGLIVALIFDLILWAISFVIWLIIFIINLILEIVIDQIVGGVIGLILDVLYKIGMGLAGNNVAAQLAIQLVFTQTVGLLFTFHTTPVVIVTLLGVDITTHFSLEIYQTAIGNTVNKLITNIVWDFSLVRILLTIIMQVFQTINFNVININFNFLLVDYHFFNIFSIIADALRSTGLASSFADALDGFITPIIDIAPTPVGSPDPIIPAMKLSVITVFW